METTQLHYFFKGRTINRSWWDSNCHGKTLLNFLLPRENRF